MTKLILQFLKALPSIRRLKGIAVVSILLFISPVAHADGPQIDLWYGDHQIFGQQGQPQRWVNILGQVTGPAPISSLTYSLNGEPEKPLAFGPDQYRLASFGDFNIDIPLSALQPGRNEIIIAATDTAGQQAVKTAVFEYLPDATAPSPYEIDWSSVENIFDVGQVVDGQWSLEEKGVRSSIPGYDRIIALGDMWWEDYEVTVPVTINRVEPQFSYPSNGAALFVVVRWQGHREWDDSQPARGWWPLGGGAEVSWITESETRIELAGNKVLTIDEDERGQQLEIGERYYFKVRVETIPGYASLYSFKFWNATNPEPVDWEFRGQQRMWDPLYGSVLLVAHHVDATFGDVTIMPIDRSPWEWFVLLGSYVAQLPLILLSVLIIFASIKNRKENRRVTQFALLAATLFIVEALGGTFLNIQLPIMLHRLGWSTHEIGIALVASETLQTTLVALGLGALVFAFYRWQWRQPPLPESGQLS
ncbi:MAG: hypothetical protein R3264_16485 [Anaerolineae bacterium]|nr:hypothetical protein [Anaerolineae bacterium]